MIEFGPPPVPGTSWLRPITNSAALAAEGEEMQHCAASYAPVVAAGRSYVYRVEGEGLERATLEVVRVWGGWRPRQILGRNNAPVNSEAERRIRLHLAGGEPGGSPVRGCETARPTRA